MAKFIYEDKDIEAVLKDIDRRVRQGVKWEGITDAEAYRETMLKGVYSALLVLSDNPVKAAVQINNVEEAYAHKKAREKVG